MSMEDEMQQQQQQQHQYDVNICCSGGADGADLLFGELAQSAGHHVIHYGFEGMSSQVDLQIVSKESLQQADSAIQAASRFMQRNPPRKSYVKNLIRRNYYQVQKVQRIYAVTRWNLVTPRNQNSTTNPNTTRMTTIEGQLGGGTGWAVAMGILLTVPEIYLYAMEKEQWYNYDYNTAEWRTMNALPPLPTGRYAGIGSRQLSETGKRVQGRTKTTSQPPLAPTQQPPNGRTSLF